MEFISEKLKAALVVFETTWGRYVALGMMVGLVFIIGRCSV